MQTPGIRPAQPVVSLEHLTITLRYLYPLHLISLSLILECFMVTSPYRMQTCWGLG
jgi:hypothetical protein